MPIVNTGDQSILTGVYLIVCKVDGKRYYGRVRLGISIADGKIIERFLGEIAILTTICNMLG